MCEKLEQIHSEILDDDELADNIYDYDE